MKTRHMVAIIFTGILMLLAPARAGASVEEMIFDGQNVYGRWDSSLWNWDVTIGAKRVTAEPWGGVYIRFVGGDGIDVSNIEYLNVQLQSTEPVLVSLVCDCGNQPVFETTGNVHLPPAKLVAAGTQKIHGVMIQSTFNRHTYTLDSVRLVLKNPLVVPTSTPTPTATNTPTIVRPTQTPQPPATQTPQPPATQTPQPSATQTPQPPATQTPQPPATQTPQSPATQTLQPPTSTPTRDHSNCGGMAQEAETGQIYGNMLAVTDSEASQGEAIVTEPRSSEARSNGHRIDFCVRLAAPGRYQIQARAKATDNAKNSMFVQVNSVLMVWHMATGPNYLEQAVSNGGSVNGNNPAAILQLSAGTHDISFFHRESGVLLDKFELIPAGSVTPTPSHTATPRPTQPPEKPDPDSLGDLIDYPIDYSNVGITGGIPRYPNTITVSGFTEKAIEDAINRAQPNTRIILSAGTYNVGTIDIRKSNIVLIGEENGCGKTTIRFGNDTGINVQSGGGIGSAVQLARNAGLNSKTITVSRGKGSSFSVGDYVFISQNDDSSLFRADLSRADKPEEWAEGNAAQMNKVVGKDGDTLILEGGLNLNYKISLGAKVAKVHNMVSGVGIENLTLERTRNKDTALESSNILFKFVANSWVQGVHSKNSIRAHIYMTRSYKNEVRGNYFDHSLDNGPGGHGYGARLQNGTTDTLVENNIANLLRHSYIAQIGANGNVFAYNYSADPYGEGNGEIYTDLSAHGGFAHSNLFEGNQAQMAKIDNIHASNSLNLYFRNRLEQDLNNFTHKSELTSKGSTTPHIWVQENQYFNSFLANEISFPGANSATQTLGFPNGRIRNNFTVCKFITSSDSERGCGRTRETTVNHGTYDYFSGQTTWDRSLSRNIPDSAYRSSKPPFWGNAPWPLFGPDTLGLSDAQKIVPAKSRYLAGDYCYSGS